jgi:hypothetical protein
MAGPVAQGGVEGGDEALVGAVDVTWHTESAAGFQGEEAAQRPGGVDGVVADDAVSGQDGEDDLQHGVSGGGVAGVVWPRAVGLYPRQQLRLVLKQELGVELSP